MSLVITILLAIAMSIDALIFGISFGIKGISIGFSSIIAITISAFLILMGAYITGEYIAHIFKYGEMVGGFLLVGIGMWLCADTKEGVKDVLTNPEKADIDKSKNIEILEAIAIGVILSIDSATIVVSSTIADTFAIILPIAVLIFQIIFILLGLKLGKNNIKNIPIKNINIICGFLIVMVGLYKLYTLFY